MKYLPDGSHPSKDTEIRHCELWLSLSLVASKDNQDQRGHVHGGVQVHEAGALQVCEGEDGHCEGGQSEEEYQPLQSGRNTDNVSVSVSEVDNVSGEDNVSVSVSEIDNISREDNVSVCLMDNISREDNVSVCLSVVTGDTVQREGVQAGGAGQGDGQTGVAADGRGENNGPGGHGLLVVTRKKRERPKKGIVPDGLVQLRIQNFVTKFDLGGEGGVQPSGISSAMRGVKRKNE